MSVEIGHYALVLALCVSFVLAFFPALGLRYAAFSPTVATATTLACALFVLSTLSLGMLLRGFAGSDFSLLLVVQHSHSAKPLLYKFAALWGNHEGSMLLWVWVLSLFCALSAVVDRPSELKTLALSVQGALAFLFLLFTLFFSNPFARVFPSALEGQGLNPILQHPALAVHPPLLYLGYVGLSAAFAYSIAALLLNRLDGLWAERARLWTLLAWCFLGAGIAMGSFWAYEELGWGGFWFWDPVENASLVPWLLATAALHTLRCFLKTNRLLRWSVLLVMLAFIASLLGTFLVRSGLLVSVHAFATDPLRGLVILAFILLIAAGATALFAVRAQGMARDQPFSPLSREAAQFLNALLMSACAVLVMLGTLYPLFYEALTNRSLTVGTPYFTRALAPFALSAFALLGLLPALGWGTTARSRLKRYLPLALAIATGSALATLAVTRVNIAATLVAMLGAWALFGAIKTRSPKDARGTAFAHAGIAVVLIAGGAASLLERQTFQTLLVGESISLGAAPFTATLQLDDTFDLEGQNYRARAARFHRLDRGARPESLVSMRRYYFPDGRETTEAAIDRSVVQDIYVTIGTIVEHGAPLSVRVQSKPLMLWLWLGAGLVVFGGLLSVFSKPSRARGTRSR